MFSISTSISILSNGSHSSSSPFPRLFTIKSVILRSPFSPSLQKASAGTLLSVIWTEKDDSSSLVVPEDALILIVKVLPP